MNSFTLVHALMYAFPCLFPEAQVGSAQREASQDVGSSGKYLLSKMFQQVVL